MDIIYINDLRIETVIGVFEWERHIKQTIIFDLDMATDIKAAADSDNLDHTLDYAAVAERLFEYVGNSEFKLVETLAEKVAELILNEFPTPWLRLKLNKKGAIPGVRDIGIIIERGDRV